MMKRYKIRTNTHNLSCLYTAEEHPQGEWCRWEDVPGWVSVEERLPEEEGRYVIVYNYKDKFFRMFIGDYFIDSDGTGRWSAMPTNAEVTHWFGKLTLPQPPEGSDDD